MNRVDELMNKYLDNDISQDELTELKETLKDPNSDLLFKTTLQLESILKKAETFKAPNFFTEKFMQKILIQKSKPDKIPIFIGLVFFVSIILVLGTAISLVNINYEQINLSAKIEHFFQRLNFSHSYLLMYLKNKVVTIIGLSSSLFLFITFLFSLGTHKTFKQKLNKY